MRILLGIMLLTITSNAQWVKQRVDTTASLRGLSVVNEKVVWASGTGGTVIRTIDGGKTWNVITVPGAEKLDFRDIEAFDANTAYVLSIGNGELSRIYKTLDGGKHWHLQFKNTSEKAFFDAIACWDEWNCIAMSDPVDGKFLFIRNYSGDTWQQLPDSDAEARKDQAAFAASGTCLITLGIFHKAFVVTGGTASEVLYSDSNGRHWDVRKAPLVSGSSGSGIFSIAMFDNHTGVIVGGNYEKPDEHEKNLAFTPDGGVTWKAGTGLSGYRSAVTYVDRNTIIAVGTNGSDITRDGGQTWLRIDDANYNSVQAKGNKAIWAAGPKGYVANLDWKDFLAIHGYHPDHCRKGVDCLGPRVDSVDLSHKEISARCEQTDSDCSDKRQVNVTVNSSDDVPPGWYTYSASGGRIVGFGRIVKWDLSEAKPGKYIINTSLKTPSENHFRVTGKTDTRVVTVK